VLFRPRQSSSISRSLRAHRDPSPFFVVVAEPVDAAPLGALLGYRAPLITTGW